MNHKQTPEYYNFTSETPNNDFWNDYFDCIVECSEQNQTQSCRRICRDMIPN